MMTGEVLWIYIEEDKRAHTVRITRHYRGIKGKNFSIPVVELVDVDTCESFEDVAFGRLDPIR